MNMGQPKCTHCITHLSMNLGRQRYETSVSRHSLFLETHTISFRAFVAGSRSLAVISIAMSSLPATESCGVLGRIESWCNRSKFSWPRFALVGMESEPDNMRMFGTGEDFPSVLETFLWWGAALWGNLSDPPIEGGRLLSLNNSSTNGGLHRRDNLLITPPGPSMTSCLLRGNLLRSDPPSWSLSSRQGAPTGAEYSLENAGDLGASISGDNRS